jgi:hypothetical protein
MSAWGYSCIVKLQQNPVIGIAKETKTAGQQCMVSNIKKNKQITMVQALTPDLLYYEYQGLVSVNKNTIFLPYANNTFIPNNLLIGKAINTHTLSIINKEF